MTKIVAHNFVRKHFNKPTWCHFCQKFIWGLAKQGYQCTGESINLQLVINHFNINISS